MTAGPNILAVVPIVVNSGAALFPAIVAAAGAALSLLFRPRALLAAVRRRPKVAVAALGVLAVAAGAAAVVWRLRPAHAAPPPPATRAVDWVGVARDLVRARQSPHAVLTKLWEHRLDDQMALATPAFHADAAGQTLYVPAMVYTTQQQYGTFWALDAGTGQVRWKAAGTVPSAGSGPPVPLRPIFSQPAVAAGGDRVLTGQGLHDDANCALLCFDVPASRRAGTGLAAWAVPTTLHLESSPALFSHAGEERVVIGAGAIEGPDRKPLGDPGFLLCVSVATGQEVWRFPLNDPEAVPVVDPDLTVYAGAGVNGNAAVAVRPPDATHPRPYERWRTALPFPATGDLALVGHPALGRFLLLGAGNGDYVRADPHPAGLVLALDPASGAVRWQRPLPDGVLGRLCVAGDAVLVGCRDGFVYCLDLQAGQIRWRTQVAAAPSVPVLAGVVVDGPYAFALASDGTLATLWADTGAPLDRVRLFDPAKFSQNLTMATPLLFGHTLYVPTETAGLHAFRIGL
jgi:outer membrane protein assembly factor BamB